MSNLMCPVRILVLRGRVDEWRQVLDSEKVAGVYAPPGSAAADDLAQVLGVAVTFDARAEGAPDLQQSGDLLAEIGDEHRGETVVVLAGSRQDDAEVTELTNDGDAWHPRRM